MLELLTVQALGECMSGLYTGFESYRVMTANDIKHALTYGFVALDTNVLLSLYRYNDKTVDDLLSVAAAVEERLFVPHQVLREFWRNRQAVIASLGSASKDAQSALSKNRTSTKDAISRWSKNVALPDEQKQELAASIDQFFDQLRLRIEAEPIRGAVHVPTSEDALLRRLEILLDGCVGAALADSDWKLAIAEGERRVLQSIPPGYMDADKLESDLEEGASGDYIVWQQLLTEGVRRGADLVLVTSDTKEDWWNRAERGTPIGARQELIDEYLQATGCRVFLLEPADLIKHSSVLGVGTSLESVEDIERVRDEEPEPWTGEAAKAVIRELELQGHVQAAVIAEAIVNGGRIARARVYEIDGREESQMLRGFTRPVKRVTSELQASGVVPYGVLPLLDARYETGVKSSHFTVPNEVVEQLAGERE